MEHPKYTYAYGKCQAPSYEQSSHWQQIAKYYPQTLADFLLVWRHHVPPAIADGTATLAGLDPRHGEANEAGHKPQSPLQAIREKFRDCSCYQLNEIRACEAVNFALWPFRAGKHPWRAEARKTPLTEANSEEQTASEDEELPSC